MSRQDRIAQVANRYTGGRKYSGIEWLLERRGEVLAQGQAGYADAETRTPIPDQALYRIASSPSRQVSQATKFASASWKTSAGDAIPIATASIASSPPGCSG